MTSRHYFGCTPAGVVIYKVCGRDGSAEMTTQMSAVRHRCCYGDIMLANVLAQFTPKKVATEVKVKTRGKRS